MNRRRLAIGDIHGNYPALKTALHHAGYKPERDRLYFLGDYIDRHTQSREVVDFIRDIPDKVCIRGNHDQYLLDHFNQMGPLRLISDRWIRNGGLQTLESFGIEIVKPATDMLFTNGELPISYLEFFHTTIEYFFTEDNFGLVHGGFDLYLSDLSGDYVMWDRSMWRTAVELETSGVDPSYPCFNTFAKIFIGHTNLLTQPDQRYCLPRQCFNVWNLDTGAGYSGPVTVMDMDTEEYWQSW